MKTVWISGISGMIGYFTAMEYLKRGWAVKGIDSFNDYYDVKLKKDRARLITEAGGEVVHEDIRDVQFDAFEGVDLVVHLAAYPNPRHSLEFPHLYIDHNITGTQCLITAIEKKSFDIPVVYASTSCVMHGQPLPWNETDRPLHQICPYGWTKWVNECQFGQSSITTHAGLRFFTVYGPYGRPDMAMYQFTKSVMAGDSITLYGNGDMKRDFTHVADIMNGLKLVADDLLQRPGQAEIYNIGRGQPEGLHELVHAISVNVGKSAVIDFAGQHPADVTETWADTSKLESLGYKPKIDLIDGVSDFVQWYREYY